MRIVEKKPVLKMTRKEFEAVKSFFSVMENSEPLANYDWSEIIDDFPRVRDETFVRGDLYDVEIEEY